MTSSNSDDRWLRSQRAVRGALPATCRSHQIRVDQARPPCSGLEAEYGRANRRAGTSHRTSATSRSIRSGPQTSTRSPRTCCAMAGDGTAASQPRPCWRSTEPSPTRSISPSTDASSTPTRPPRHGRHGPTDVAVFDGDLPGGQVDADVIDAVELGQTHPDELFFGGAVHATDAEPADCHRCTRPGVRPSTGKKRPTRDA